MAFNDFADLTRRTTEKVLSDQACFFSLKCFDKRSRDTNTFINGNTTGSSIKSEIMSN